MSRPNFGELVKEIRSKNQAGPTTSPKGAKSGAVATPDPISEMAQQTDAFKRFEGSQGVNEGNLKRGAFGRDYFKQRILGFDGGDVVDASEFNRYNGGIDPFSSGEDYEYIRRNAQGNLAAGVNVAGSFVAKTGNNIAGAIVGGFYGLGKGVGRYAFTDASLVKSGADVFDNEFLRGSDKFGEAIDRNTTVFTSEKAKNDGVFGMFGSIETIKDVSDAAAFIAGAIATEIIMETAGNAIGGSGIATAAGRWGKLAANASKTFAGKTLGIDKLTGIGRYGRRVGEEAKLISAFLNKGEDVAAMTAIERAAMKEGMGVEALKNHYNMINSFEKAAIGTRKAFSGTIYESSMEARQTKKMMMDTSRASVEEEARSMGKTGEDAERYIAMRMEQEENESNKLGLVVLAANVGLLSLSNKVQFPQIFGKGSYDALKRINGNAGKFIRKEITDKAILAEQKGIKKFLNGSVNLLKSPVAEFMEETGQGVISKSTENYHERRSNGRSSAKGMEVSTSNFLSDFTDSFGEALSNQYGTKDGIYEGLIGALLGAVGVPGVKRHANGKYKGMTVHGGIWEGFKGTSIEEQTSIQNAIDTLNFGNTIDVLKDNSRRSKEAARRTEDENNEFENNDFSRKNNHRDDKVFNKVKEYYDKGLQSYLAEEMQALDDMTLEQYAASIGDETVTQEERERDMKDLYDKMKNYGDAYTTVYEKMKMKDIADSPVNKQLLDHLVYAIGTDVESLRQIKGITARLAEKGMLMSPEKIAKLASLHADFGTMSNDDISKEIDDIHYNTLRAGLQESRNGEKLTNDSLNGYDFKFVNKFKRRLQLLDNAHSKEDFDRHLAFIEKQSPEDAAALKNTPVFKRAATLFSKDNLDKHLEKSNALAEKRKTEILDENELIQENNKKNNIELAEKYQTKDSEVMNALIDKHKILTASDLKEYVELMKEYRGYEQKANEASGSFLDKLANEEALDYNNALHELSELARRRDTSLRVAASLYGLENLRFSSFKVFHAEMVANLRNLTDYIDQLELLLFNEDDLGDEGIEVAMLVENIKLATTALNEDKESIDKLLMENPSESLKNNLNLLLSHANSNIERANELVELYGEIEKITEAKEILDAKEEQSPEEIAALGDVLQNFADAAELDEYEALQDLVELTLPVVTQKESVIIYTTGLNGEDGKTLNKIHEAAKDGTIELKDVVYLTPDMTTSEKGKEDKRFVSALSEVIYEDKTYYDFYLSGEAKFNADKGIVATSRADFELKEDGTFDFSNPDADLHIFISAFRVNMKFTKDEAIPAKNGGNRTVEKSDNESVKENLYFFAPFFLLNQEKAKQLVVEIKKLKQEAVVLKAEIDNDAEGQNRNAKKRDLELLLKKIIGKENKSNDKSIYNTRKRILVEKMFHDKKEDSEGEYSMESYVSLVSFGELNEHSIPGEFSNFPISSNDPTTPNTLFKGTNEELLKSGTFGYVNQEGFVFDPKSRKKISGVSGGKQTGHLYYIHTTPAGVKVPVHLNRGKIGANEDVLNGLMKFFEESISSKDGMSNLKSIKNVPISIEKGDFGGLFDDKIALNQELPKTLNDLVSLFLMTNSGKKGSGLESAFFGIGKEFEAAVVNNKGDNSLAEVEHDASIDTGISKENNVETVSNANFNFQESDTQEVRLQKIREVVSNSFFRMQVRLFLKNDSIDKKALDFVMGSGLITHGFSEADTFDTIFKKDAPVGITISPMNSTIVQNSMDFRKRKLVKSGRDLLKDLHKVTGYKPTYKNKAGDTVHTAYGTKEIVELFLNKAAAQYREVIKTYKEKGLELPTELDRSNIVRDVFKDITLKTRTGIVELLTTDNAKKEAEIILQNIANLKGTSLSAIKANAANLIESIKKLNAKRKEANADGTTAGIRPEEFIMLFTLIQTESNNLMVNSPFMFNRISKGFNSEIGLFNLVDKIYPSEKNEDDYHKLTGVKRDNENGVSLSEPEQATEKYVKSLIEAISTFNELDKTTQKLTSITSKGKSLPIRLTINEILPNDSTNHTKVSLIKKSDKKEFATTEVRKDGSVINDIKIETINNAKGFTFFISEKAAEGDGMINSEISLEEAKTKFTYDRDGNLLNGMIFVNRFRTSKAGKVIASFPTPVMWGSKNKKTVLLNKAGNTQDVKHTSSFVGNFDFPGYTNSNGELVKNSKELDSINASIDDERNSKNYELAEFMDVRKEKGNTSTIQHSMDEYESYLKEQDSYRNEIEKDNPELSTAVPKPKSKTFLGDLEDENPLSIKLEVEEDYSAEIVTMEGLNGKKFTGTEAEVMKAIQAQYNEELEKKKSSKGKKEEAPKKKYKDLGSILANEVVSASEDEFSFNKEAYELISEDDIENLVKGFNIIMDLKSASASALQRGLKMGYNRAGRFIEVYELLGLIGEFTGASSRQILSGNKSKKDVERLIRESLKAPIQEKKPEVKVEKPAKKEDDSIIKDAKIEAEAYLSEEVTEFSAEMIADIFSNVISSKGKDAAFVAITKELINNSKVSKIKITKASYEYLYTAIFNEAPSEAKIEGLLKQCTI